MRIFLLSLLLCLPIFAQNTNIHFGVNTGGSRGLGLNGATYGVTAGVDYKYKRFLLASDTEFFHLCKHSVACGNEIAAKSELAYYLKPHFAVQVGIRAAAYDIHVFRKANVQGLAGVRLGADKLVTELNYRHDIQDLNRQHIGELLVTCYLKHHIFIRGGASYIHFYQGKTAMSGTTTSFAIGWYKERK